MTRLGDNPFMEAVHKSVRRIYLQELEVRKHLSAIELEGMDAMYSQQSGVCRDSPPADTAVRCLSGRTRPLLTLLSSVSGLAPADTVVQCVSGLALLTLLFGVCWESPHAETAVQCVRIRPC